MLLDKHMSHNKQQPWKNPVAFMLVVVVVVVVVKDSWTQDLYLVVTQKPSSEQEQYCGENEFFNVWFSSQ